MSNPSENFNGSAEKQLDQISTLAELLIWRARLHPEKVAYRFLDDDNQEKAVLTYGELHRRAALIAACLRMNGLPGDRAVLLYPAGLEFICAFFACMYANMVAVPIASPRGRRRLEHLERIAKDADARFVLTTEEFYQRFESVIPASPQLSSVHWERTDCLAQSGGNSEIASLPDQGLGAGADSLALLQYTSGSTSVPRGVMVTHRNLLHNAGAMKRQYGFPDGETLLSWLPMYHDMGLIGGVIQTVYSGAHCIVMSPISFVRRPESWLEAVSRYKVFLSGGPNFSYELCINKIKMEQLEALDLSHWQVATNGAEPVRVETMERFAAIFSRFGFRKESFNPSYGLAEATLIVSCSAIAGSGPHIETFDGNALQRNRVEPGDDSGRRLSSVGQVVSGQRIVIVDPVTNSLCASDQIGEIWVTGPSVAQGYWNNSVATANTFGARLGADGEAGFLRTGDLGFLKGQELFVTGRLKEVIIVNGLNHYPQDLERSVETAHVSLQPGAGAAFSIVVNGEEKLVIAFEVKRAYLEVDADAVADAIREVIAKEHETSVHEVVLVRPGSIPKTSSGKIQRGLCRERFLSGTLESIAARANAPAVSLAAAESAPQYSDATSVQVRDKVHRVTEIIVAAVARSTGQLEQNLPLDKDLFGLGIDSLKGVEIVHGLEAKFGVSLPPTLLFEAPTIAMLASELVNRLGSREIPLEFQSEAYSHAPSNLESHVGTEDLATQNKPPAETLSRSRPLKKTNEPEGIAVVGMSCRVPGAPNLESFWRLLEEGRDAICEIPSERWDWTKNYDRNPAAEGKSYSRWGGFLGGIDQFDAAFFNISAREAKLMDPQQRIFLEIASETFEHAGYSPKTLSEAQVGVFVGCSNNGYYSRITPHLKQSDHAAGIGNQNPIIANRVSFFLNLHGPSILVDTMCSSSLVAIHLACQSLRLGECDLALAGGINLLLSPEYYVALSRMKAHAPDGRCKAFDQRANGLVSGEGGGALLLKPLSRALESRDTIYAVIKGTAVNHGGYTNGLTAPNPKAQARVIRQALDAAGVSADSISYVEAHGTGTSLGDPIELAGLTEAFRRDSASTQWCALGSVKTNIGHLEPAAGIAGMIKVILSMQHRKLPASLHFETANPIIKFEESPFYVNTGLAPWVAEGPRRAGVSSFGLGGVNAHAVVEEAVIDGQAAPMPDEHPKFNLFALSARTEPATRSLAQRYVDFLSQTTLPLSDICFTANTGRSHFSRRLAVVADSTAQLQQSLERFLQSEDRNAVESVKPGKEPQVAFLYTGQGGEVVGMGRQLFESCVTFRQAIEQCDNLVRPYLKQGLVSFLYSNAGASDLDASQLQPAMFALQYAFTELWRSWGVFPSIVVGHSLGEYAAACAARVFSLEEGIKLVAERARLMSGLSRIGRMAAVFADEEQVSGMIGPFRDRVSIAAANSSRNTVISGDEAAMESILETLRLKGIASEWLHVSHAFHSPLMDPMLDRFQEIAGSITYRGPDVPMVSTVTGRVLEPGELPDAAYWRRHTRNPVQFAKSMRSLAAQSCSILLEIGSRNGLLSSAKRSMGREDVIYLSSLTNRDDVFKTLFTSLGALYSHGVDINWNGVYRDQACRRVALPTYPFERQRHWLEEETGTRRDSGRHSEGPSHSGTKTALAVTGATNVIPSQKNGQGTRSRGEAILLMLRQRLAALLEMEETAVDDSVPFLELGADSLVLLEALQAIQDLFGVKLAMRQLFEEFTNLEMLACHIDQLLPAEMQFDSEEREETQVQQLDVDRLRGPLPVVATAVTAKAQVSPSNGHHAHPDISGLLNQQMQMMREIISEQLQILHDR